MKSTSLLINNIIAQKRHRLKFRAQLIFTPLFRSPFGLIFCVLFRESNSNILDKKKFDQIFLKLSDLKSYLTLTLGYLNPAWNNPAQDDILRAIDNHSCVILLLLDLLAAFDTVDHQTLLHRLLHRFDIVDCALEWFRSYLSDRYQTVKVNGGVSSSRELHYGVRQGSIHGPIVFLLYTSPLDDIMRHHKVNFHLYADDTQLYLTFKSSTADLAKLAIEDCLRDIDAWMTANMLKMNRDKTELVVLNASLHPPPPLTSISVCDELIDCDEKGIYQSPYSRNTCERFHYFQTGLL